MNEASIYADNFGINFFDENSFLAFLVERSRNSWWKVETTQDLSFRAMDDGTDETQNIIDEYNSYGKTDILNDTAFKALERENNTSAFTSTRQMLSSEKLCDQSVFRIAETALTVHVSQGTH